MLSLEHNLKRNKSAISTYIGGAIVTAAVFICMGMMHFNIEMPAQEETEPITEFYLPPPPPPPQEEPPTKQNTAFIGFDVPTTDRPADIPLGFLDVDFGLKPKELTGFKVNVDESLDNYQTDGLETLKIYSQNEVTEKPRRTYQPQLEIPRKYTRLNRDKPIKFVVLYTVTEQGRTANIHVLDCPIPEIVPLIRKYISSWRLKPATKDGKPVNSWVQHKFTYKPASSSPFSL